MNEIDLNSINIGSIGRKPFSERVYESLKVAIINGDIPEGTKLTETELAGKLGVSPTPVREAFRRLASEGFVSIAPWRGATVQSFSEREMIETYQCREVLEGLAGRLAAENIDSNGVKKLRRLLKESTSSQSTSEIVENNSAIHNVIFEYARNSKLTALLGVFSDRILRDRNITACNDKRRDEIRLEHADIINAIEERNPEKAEQAMRNHVRNGFAYKMQHND